MYLVSDEEDPFDCDNLADMFGNVEVDDYELTVNNAPGGDNNAKDKDLMNLLFSKAKTDLMVNKIKRVGNQKPKQMKVSVKTKKKLADAKKEEIAKFLHMTNESNFIKKTGISFHPTDIEEYRNGSLFTMVIILLKYLYFLKYLKNSNISRKKDRFHYDC